MNIEKIGTATLYHGDCMEILPTLPQSGCVITDPPYGIADKWVGGKGHGWGNQDDMKCVRNKWDSEPLGDSEIDVILKAGKNAIIWGGNYFNLPASRCWYIWNKPERNFTLAEAEMAWTNFDNVVRVFDCNRSDTHREHPTQKPIRLMEWCVSKTKGSVVDPFLGSGTTGVACVNQGREFIGIELNERYYQMSCERIYQASLQGRLIP